jgi:hypothetical protein
MKSSKRLQKRLEPTSLPAKSPMPGKRTTLVICAGLILLFAVLSMTAVNTKSATYDEHLHLTGAWSNLWLRDYRVDPANFALWEYWAALPLGPNGLHLNRDDPNWQKQLTLLEHTDERWEVDMLYRTPGVNADDLFRRSRLMMLILNASLIGIAALWAYQLGGNIAAIATTTLFAFDPNFLGHAPLVKNDVVIALLLVVACFATWRVGRKATIGNLAALGLICAAAVNTKMSGLWFGPMMEVLLLGRALVGKPWQFVNLNLVTRASRTAAVVLWGLCAVLAIYVAIWACYGFRFSTTPNPNEHFNIDNFVSLDRYFLAAKYYDGKFPADDKSWMTWQPSVPVRVAEWMDAKHLLPQPYLAGIMLYTAECHYRPGFVLGNFSHSGWWFYFPFGVLVKTPVAELGIGALVLILCIFSFRSIKWLDNGWTIACLLIPASVYMLMAMSSTLQIGVRHVLPVYSLAYLLIAGGIALIWDKWRWQWRIPFGLLMTALICECALAYPNYIAYFNSPSGGSQGGLRLLSDSNLDWGQDVKQLGKWVAAHPNDKLYLRLTSMADPSYYGIRYVPVFGGYRFGIPNGINVPRPGGQGFFVIDANALQGTFSNEESRNAIAPLRQMQPVAVIGGTIYIYPCEFPGSS